MTATQTPAPVNAHELPQRTRVTFYPEPFASRVMGRGKRRLGDLFALNNFGVNLTSLAPDAMSSVRHCHSKQDEFVYIVQGRPTLVTDHGRWQLAPGMCMGFPAGTGNAHHLCNETDEDVLFLEIGDRTADDEVIYPDDDLALVRAGGEARYVHKDGTPY